MKKRLLIAFSALLIFGLVAAALAYTRANAPTETSSVSCPMHKQMASAGEQKDSCCGMADCCKDGKCSQGGACCKSGDSCPLKQKGESKTTDDAVGAQVNAGEGESCCKPGAECCKAGGACCKHKS